MNRIEYEIVVSGEHSLSRVQWGWEDILIDLHWHWSIEAVQIVVSGVVTIHSHHYSEDMQLVRMEFVGGVEVDNVGEVVAAVGSAVWQVALFSADFLTRLALVLKIITVTKNKRKFNLISYYV